MFIELHDTSDSYGILEIEDIETHKDLKKIAKLLDTHRQDNEEYNVDSFISFLRQKRYKVRHLQPIETLYF